MKASFLIYFVVNIMPLTLLQNVGQIYNVSIMWGEILTKFFQFLFGTTIEISLPYKIVCLKEKLTPNSTTPTN